MKKVIVGIGSALVDILAHETDDFLHRSGAVKGGMTLVDNAAIENVLTGLKSSPRVVPGGSACNTMIGIARLGGISRFVGKRGVGPMGAFFETGLLENGVEPHLLHSPTRTGRVLSIITPDAQRSMLTYLGASSEIQPEEIAETCFEGAAVVHIEGYLLFNPTLMLQALSLAKRSGARISLDLASFTVVESNKLLLDQIVDEFVDILIANEDEARAFTGHTDEERMIESLSSRADIAVLKIGNRGSYVSHQGKTLKVEPLGDGSALDTTGAGDLWASGFLFGLVNSYDLEKCGQLASACGYEVCQVVGAGIPHAGWDRIRKLLK
jgi:sugar/nucleoside kinase (ribokinase family)